MCGVCGGCGCVGCGWRKVKGVQSVSCSEDCQPSHRRIDPDPLLQGLDCLGVPRLEGQLDHHVKVDSGAAHEQLVSDAFDDRVVPVLEQGEHRVPVQGRRG